MYYCPTDLRPGPTTHTLLHPRHRTVAIWACIDCLGQWFLNFFESGTGRWFMMLFVDHKLEMLKFQLAISNKIWWKIIEIEAWFEGVIIGVWQAIRESKPDDDATRAGMQWQIWDLKYGVAPWRGPLSCLTTNAFTLKLVKPCSPIFLVAMAVFFAT